MILQARELTALQPLPKRAAYASSILSLWVLAAVTALVSWGAGIDRSQLGLVAMPAGPLLVWTMGLVLAGVAVVAIFHAVGFRESDITRQLVPESPDEKAWFAGVSLTAGICEEFVFRGFLLYAIHTASGSLVLAVAVSSAAFGVIHAYQQGAGTLRAGILGAVLALPLAVAGSIWPAILAHAIIDLLAGLVFARWLTR
jgi:uncharacterized protein